MPDDPIPPQFLESVKVFPKLRKLDTLGLNAPNWLFTDSGVKVPNLQEVRYRDRWVSDHNNANRFWDAHKSIKAIFVDASSDQYYHRSLSGAPDIEEMTVRIASSSERRWLAPLCEPTTNEKTGLSSYMFPNLRMISVLGHTRFILRASFEDFVRIRCYPVDENGYTVAGCRAIDHLKIQLRANEPTSKVLQATEAWRKAVVWKDSTDIYELRWMYHHPEPLVLDTANGGGASELSKYLKKERRFISHLSVHFSTCDEQISTDIKGFLTDI